MDHSNDDAFAGRRIASDKIFVSSTGSNFDTGATYQSRLQKQRSNGGMRSASHGQPFSSAPQSIAVMRGDNASSGGFGDGTKARKGSIRNAVKKIFGRRGREVVSHGPEPNNHHPPASRHAYHKSEPTGLPPPREEPEPFIQDTNLIERTLADPYQATASQPYQRTSSPYAVQFPNSVRLKPMDLGNPFIAPPNQLRRRKTLPSLLLEEREESAADAHPRESTDIEQAEPMRQTPTHPPQRATSHVKKNRRKSRSADDLKSSSTIEPASPRKKSEEIRYLRESFQPDVLRASGFTTRYRRREEEFEEQPTSAQRRSPKEYGGSDEERTQAPPHNDAFQAAPESALRSSPPVQHGHRPSPSSGDVRPSSGAGTEMSKDLEDRVAKLEAGLQNFQLSLQKLTAERNRRTIVMGSVNTRRSSTDMRTPSLLADTLADALEPSSYEYEYGHTYRPSTSPQPPPGQAQGSLEDPFGPDIPRASASKRASIPPPPASTSASAPTHARSSTAATAPSHHRSSTAATAPTHHRSSTTATVATDRNPETFPMPLQSHPPTQQPPSTTATKTTTTKQTQPQPYTFSSLYQMLSDERSARRKLENQLKSLQREISDLHTQVATNIPSSSNVHSARSSYMLAGSSTRLQELLRETEGGGSPDQSPRSAQHARDSGLSAARGMGMDHPVISRFSGSESEAAGGEFEDLTTPYEHYRTPREERSAYSLVTGKVDSGRGEAEMF